MKEEIHKKEKKISSADLKRATSNHTSTVGLYLAFLEENEGERERWPLTVFWDLDRLGSFILYCERVKNGPNTIANKIGRINEVKGLI